MGWVKAFIVTCMLSSGCIENPIWVHAKDCHRMPLAAQVLVNGAKQDTTISLKCQK
jgi:hypothetical protein